VAEGQELERRRAQPVPALDRGRDRRGRHVRWLTHRGQATPMHVNTRWNFLAWFAIRV
jgi:hypothetical protein